MIRRFEREAQTTATLQSQHTVQVYDFGVTEEGALYYVMEYLEGLDLQTLIEKYGPISPERAVHFLLQILESLDEAHQAGLVHRDIKPANIIASKYGVHYDFIKVLDFGLARCIETPGNAGTLFPMVAGTPAFMAPESAFNTKEADARADIYAVGAVGYWMLTGRLIFEGLSGYETLLEQVNTPPVPPSQRTETAIPPELERHHHGVPGEGSSQAAADCFGVDRQLESCASCAPWTPDRAEHWWQAHRPTSRRQQNAELPQTGGRGGVMKSGRRDSTMHAAAFGAAALIASQVAGKATRDAFFLSQFPVTALPVMVIVASLLSVAAGFVTASPPEHPSDKPVSFMGLRGEFCAPHAGMVDLHVESRDGRSVDLSANDDSGSRSDIRILVSGGRSFRRSLGAQAIRENRCSEHVRRCRRWRCCRPCGFQHRDRKHAAGPWRSFISSGPSWQRAWHQNIKQQQSGPARGRSARPVPVLQSFVPFPMSAMWRSSSCFQRWAQALLDYVFKARVSAAYSDDTELVEFFALFYTAISVATFLVQLILSRVAVEKFGIAGTVSSLPFSLAFGSIGALILPGVPAASAMRGSEAMIRSSLFKSGYEMLYAAVPRRERQATKAILDVGVDRLGDLLGALLLGGIAWAFTDSTTMMLIGAALLGVVGLFHFPAPSSWLCPGSRE